MRNRPHSVTIISAMFILAGVVGLLYHSSEITADFAFDYELVWIFAPVSSARRRH
jgi:hypothetical protein